MNFILFLDNIRARLRGLYYVFLSGLTILLFLTGCTTTRNLKDNEYLLYKQQIKGNKKLSRESLGEILRQKPNRKILGFMPYLSFYYFGKKFYDTADVARDIKEKTQKYDKKIAAATTERKKENLTKKKDKKLENLEKKLKDGNWWMRAPGEPPSLYDSTLIATELQQLNLYLHSNGFFQGHAFTKTDTLSRKRIAVTFNVQEGKPYILANALKYDTTGDLHIDSLLTATAGESAILPGQIYRADQLSTERERINTLLKNNGYYDFSRQYVFFEVDTLLAPYTVNVTTSIEAPSAGKHHKKYHINDVFFDADATLSAEFKKDTVVYNDINMVMAGKNYSARILNYKIRQKKNQIYRQEDLQLTQKDLAGLDMFKFVNINFEKNRKDTAGNSLNVFIKTSPLKKFQITDEAGLTISSAGFIPGPFGNIIFRTRNALGGFETFDINLKASVEGYRSTKNANTNSSELGDVSFIQEYNGNLSLTFPEFLFPLRLVRYQFRKYSPRTSLQGGAGYIKRYEFDRFTVRNSLVYNWSKSKYKNYSLALINLSLNRTTRIEPEYEKIILKSQSKSFQYSFKNSLITDINYTYVYNTNTLNTNTRSKFIKCFIEPGGTIWNIPGLATNSKVFGLNTYRYVRGNIDLRLYNPVTAKSTLAARFNLGLSLPYDTTGALPYDKYFFAGGTNSIRAWTARRLGPGSYAERDSITGKKIYRSEQPGEILLETSVEYRFNIISYLDGAFFVDAGNIWAMNKKTAGNRTGAEFDLNKFYRQIAVGTGFGLRFNFSFLILRFDLGFKTFDPSEPKGSRFVLPRIAEKSSFGPKNLVNYNIGIGYPF